MIPEAAVEAAAAYVHEQFHGSPLSVYKDGYQREYKDTIRHALELAAPHMLSHERQQTADAHRDAMVNAQTVDKLNKAIIAVNKVLDEKYRLWAAICGNTCSKDVLGVDHDAIADEVGNVIRSAMAEALSK